MTTAQINAARKASRAAIEARLKTYKAPSNATPGHGLLNRPPTLLTPAERAALITTEAAKPKSTGCCGH